MFMLFTVTQDTTVHFMTVSLIDSMVRVQSDDDKAAFVFVGDENAHHSEWLESVCPTDQHGRDALDFAICQVVSSLFAVPPTVLVTDSIL